MGVVLPSARSQINGQAMVTDAATIEGMLAEAAVARQKGCREDELQLLQAACNYAPKHPRVLNARGMRALADEDGELARRCFQDAAAADPGEPVLWMNLAAACRAIGDDDGEEAALSQALSLDRLLFLGHVRLAELHQRRGRAARAAKAWSAVIQMAADVSERPPGVEAALRRAKAYIAAHRQDLSNSLDVALEPRLVGIGSEARRFRACVDHALGRRAIYRNECAGVHYPFLPADEFFDREHFPWVAAVEAQTDAIREEALALLRRSDSAIRPYVQQETGTPQNKWTPLDGSLDWGACFLWEYGRRNDAVCDLCPATEAALEAVPAKNHIPGKAPTAFFSILRAGTHIPPHTGVTNTRAIVHLPLLVPAGCRFRVGGETRVWEEGRAFAFDDTIEHEAWNESTLPRIVLIFDVWNPHLSETEQDLLCRFFEITAEESSNERQL